VGTQPYRSRLKDTRNRILPHPPRPSHHPHLPLTIRRSSRLLVRRAWVGLHNHVRGLGLLLLPRVKVVRMLGEVQVVEMVLVGGLWDNCLVRVPRGGGR